LSGISIVPCREPSHVDTEGPYTSVTRHLLPSIVALSCVWHRPSLIQVIVRHLNRPVSWTVPRWHWRTLHTCHTVTSDIAPHSSKFC